MGDKRFAVSIEICHILDKEHADRLAEQIRDRLYDIPEDVYVCVSEYEKVQNRIMPTTHIQKLEKKDS